MKPHPTRRSLRLQATLPLVLTAALLGACGDDALSPIRGGSWADRAPLKLGPRMEAQAVTLGQKIYVVGGFDSAGTLTSAVEVYEPATDSWSTVEPLPEALHHPNVAVVSGLIYVLGGAVNLSFGLTGNSYVYDPAKGQWQALAPLPAGKERAAAAVGVHEGKILLAGGGQSGEVSLDSVLAYDTKTDSWSELPSLPSTRFHAMGAVIKGVFYVIGGIIIQPDTHLPAFRDDTWALDLEGGGWQSRATMPVARGGCAAGARGEEILCISGVGAFNVNGGVPPDVQVYDTHADAWRVLPPMPMPRTATASAFVGDSFYVIGGAYVQKFQALDVNQSFTIDSGGE